MTPETTKALSITALTLSIVFFAMGMYFPLFSTHKQLLFKFGYKEMNIFQSITMFFKEKEYFLAGIILVFTFVLPVFEYIGLIIRIFKKKTSRIMRNIDKWNMLDVFLIALLLLNFKMNSNFIVMELRMGTTFIALAVIIRIITICLITKLNKQT